MRVARGLFAAHLIALAFGLAGLLIALPNPELWSADPRAVRVFDLGMGFGGQVHILFGAATMLAYGLARIGARRTLIFFAVATVLSLASELIGTGTGWPFGAYSYTDFLGYKIGGRVPYTIPLSWFYVGFAVFLIGGRIAQARGLRPAAVWAIVIGGWLLTVWDLVLDPAMAHESLLVKFWIWHETGPYFGMPWHNFVGWTATGVAFMGLSRLIWRSDPAPDTAPIGLPIAIYAANLAFASVLSASVGLYLPIALAILLGLVPIILAARRPADPARRSAPAPSATP